MTVRAWVERIVRGVAAVVAGAGLLLLAADTAGAAPHQDAPAAGTTCDLSMTGRIDGETQTIDLDSQRIADAAHEDHALGLDVQDLYLFTGTAVDGTVIKVQAHAIGGWPGASDIGTVEGTDVRESFRIATDAPEIGVGRYDVTFDAGVCGEHRLWVDIGGRFWPITLPSLLSWLALAGGGTSLVLSTVGAYRTGRVSAVGWMGAIPAGLALNVLAQQAGVAHVDAGSLALSGSVPSAAGAAFQQVASFVGRSMAGALGTGVASSAGVGAIGGGATVDAPADAAPARHLQAELAATGGPGAEEPLTQSLLPGRRHRISVWIGPPEAVVRAAQAFPQELLDPAESWELTVFLEEIVCVPEPISRTITLPATGRSTRADFEIDVPADVTSFNADITVLQGERILQAAELRARVEPVPDPDDRVELLARRVRPDDGYPGRPSGGAALAVRTQADGGVTLSTYRGRDGRLRRIDGVTQVVQKISRELTKVASDTELKLGLGEPKTAKLLRLLAYHGKLLRDELVAAQVDPEVLDERRLQVVTRDSEVYVPFEFVYDRGSPRDKAPLCDNAVQALTDGGCAGSCPEGIDGPLAPVVCPIGFWCLNRVVERHALRRIGDLDDSEIELETEPTAERNRLAPVASALFAFSDRVDAREGERRPSAYVEEVLQRVTKGRATVATTWDEWRSGIAAQSPDLLVLLAHTVEDDDLGATALQIGAGDALPCGSVDESFVRSPQSTSPPVVLLLGCETALAGQGVEDFLTRFQERGASIVVGTLATVLGYQAAPVAAALVEALAGAVENGEASFGEVLVDLRRRLLARGYVMALTLTAYGDADWQLTSADALVPA